MSETNLYPKFLVAASEIGSRLFRNQVGMAYQGVVHRPCGTGENGTRMLLFPGDIVLRKARAFMSGLTKGASDLCGLTSVVVTPEMVGQTIAIFTVCEAKSEKGKLSADQVNFLEAMEGYGAICVVARELEEFQTKLKRAIDRKLGKN